MGGDMEGGPTALRAEYESIKKERETELFAYDERRMEMQQELENVRRQLEEEKSINDTLKAGRDSWLKQMERTLKDSQSTLTKIHTRNLDLQKENDALVRAMKGELDRRSTQPNTPASSYADPSTCRPCDSVASGTLMYQCAPNMSPVRLPSPHRARSPDTSPLQPPMPYPSHPLPPPPHRSPSPHKRRLSPAKIRGGLQSPPVHNNAPGVMMSPNPHSIPVRPPTRQMFSPKPTSSDRHMSPPPTTAHHHHHHLPSPSSKAATVSNVARASWLRFTRLAQDQFPGPDDLALVSIDTLKSLVKHYGIRDPIEAARIEVYWRLLALQREANGGKSSLKKKDSTSTQSTKPPWRGGGSGHLPRGADDALDGGMASTSTPRTVPPGRTTSPYRQSPRKARFGSPSRVRSLSETSKFQPVEHPRPFVIPPPVKGPHLTRRNSLAADAVPRSCNPNVTQAKQYEWIAHATGTTSTGDRPHRKVYSKKPMGSARLRSHTQPLPYKPSSNPLDTPSAAYQKDPEGVRMVQAVPHSEKPQGKRIFTAEPIGSPPPRSIRIIDPTNGRPSLHPAPTRPQGLRVEGEKGDHMGMPVTVARPEPVEPCGKRMGFQSQSVANPVQRPPSPAAVGLRTAGLPTAMSLAGLSDPNPLPGVASPPSGLRCEIAWPSHHTDHNPIAAPPGDPPRGLMDGVRPPAHVDPVKRLHHLSDYASAPSGVPHPAPNTSRSPLPAPADAPPARPDPPAPPPEPPLPMDTPAQPVETPTAPQQAPPAAESESKPKVAFQEEHHTTVGVDDEGDGRLGEEVPLVPPKPTPQTATQRGRAGVESRCVDRTGDAEAEPVHPVRPRSSTPVSKRSGKFPQVPRCAEVNRTASPLRPSYKPSKLPRSVPPTPSTALPSNPPSAAAVVPPTPSTTALPSNPPSAAAVVPPPPPPSAPPTEAPAPDHPQLVAHASAVSNVSAAAMTVSSIPSNASAPKRSASTSKGDLVRKTSTQPSRSRAGSVGRRSATGTPRTLPSKPPSTSVVTSSTTAPPSA